MGINNDSSNNYLIEDENMSDYYGLQTSQSENNENLDNCSKNNLDTRRNSQIKEEKTITSEKSDKMPTTFEWDKGGKNVYVTGSFCNWKEFFLMNKSSQGTFLLTLNLPKGNHQYKFKVDNQWKFNDKFPICNNCGNINNYLDTTKWEIIVQNSDEGTTVQTSNTTDNNEIISNNNGKSKALHKLKMNKYSNYIPNKDEFNEKIPALPDNYKYPENINLLSNQNYIGNRNLLKVSEDNILSDNISYKNIRNIYHEQINHIIVNNNSNNIKSIICSISSRYRSKITTFVYYNSTNMKNPSSY